MTLLKCSVKFIVRNVVGEPQSLKKSENNLGNLGI